MWLEESSSSLGGLGAGAPPERKALPAEHTMRSWKDEARCSPGCQAGQPGVAEGHPLRAASGASSHPMGCH